MNTTDRGTGFFMQILAAALALLALAGGLHAAVKSADAMLAELTVEPSELPAGWTLEDVGTGDDLHDHINANLTSFKEKHGDFSFKGKKLSTPGKSCLVYIFTCENDNAKRWLLGTLEINAKNWEWSFFPAGDAVIMAVTKDQAIVSGLKEIFGSKVGLATIDKALELLGAGNAYEAEKTIKTAVDSAPESMRVCLSAAAFYLDKFSPPKVEKAAELYSKAIEAAKKAAAGHSDLFAAHEGRARALLAMGSAKDARDDFMKAVEISSKTGLRTKARALAGLARLEAASGNAAEAAACLEKAFDIEKAFGSAEIYMSVRNDKGLESVLKDGRFKDVAGVFGGIVPPEAIADPESEAIKLSSAKILVAPVSVKQGAARMTELEEEAESGLKGKFGSKGFSFGKNRVLLSRWGLEEFSSKLCEYAADSVLGAGSFDLAAYKGNRFDVPGYVNKLARKAEDQGVLKGIPDCVAAMTVEVSGSDPSKLACSVRMTIVHLKSGRAAVYLAYSFESPEKNLKAKIKGIAIEAMKKVESSFKKNGGNGNHYRKGK